MTDRTSQHPPSPAPWMRTALGYVGVRELVGGQLNPRVRAMFDATRFPREMITRQTSWCAAYACAVLEESGYASPHSARARDFLAYGLPVERPSYGTIAVFSRGLDPRDAKGHVGFVVDADGQDLLILGGNQANCVCIRSRPYDQLLGLRWPVTAQQQGRP